MFTILLVVQVLLGLTLIGLVLLQQGKGADMGAAFGSGASSTVFGARGGGSFFTRMTGVLAAAFFVNGILLSTPLVRDDVQAPASVTETVVPMAAEEIPADAPVPEDLPVLPDVPAQDVGVDDLPE